MTRKARIVAAFFCGLLPTAASALEQRSIQMTTGIRISFATAIENLVSFLAGTIVVMSVMFFLIGAVFLIASHGSNTDFLEKGKKSMRNSLIGLAIVLSSYAILRTAFFILY